MYTCIHMCVCLILSKTICHLGQLALQFDPFAFVNGFTIKFMFNLTILYKFKCVIVVWCFIEQLMR